MFFLVPGRNRTVVGARQRRLDYLFFCVDLCIHDQFTYTAAVLLECTLIINSRSSWKNLPYSGLGVVHAESGSRLRWKVTLRRHVPNRQTKRCVADAQTCWILQKSTEDSSSGCMRFMRPFVPEKRESGTLGPIGAPSLGEAAIAAPTTTRCSQGNVLCRSTALLQS